MGNDISAAYYARKHYGEILASEKTGSHVVDYLRSLETALREGEIASRSPLDGGGERVIVRRPVLDEAGNVKTKTDKKGITKESYLRAVDIIGNLVVPTYGGVAAAVDR